MPSLHSAASSFNSSDISFRLFVSAAIIVGTIRPRSVSTATPRFTSANSTASSPLSIQAFIYENSPNVRDTPYNIRSPMVTFFIFPCSCLNRSRSVWIPEALNTEFKVSCAVVCREFSIFWAITRRIFGSFTVFLSPEAARTSGFLPSAMNRIMSSSKILFSAPEGRIT